MGIDPTLFWENLFLCDYEVDFILSLIRTDKPRAIKFKNASRFIDDKCNLSDFGEFSKPFHVIYPNEMQL